MLVLIWVTSLSFAGKMDCDKCGICQEEISNDDKLYVTLTEKGALGVCNASKERCDDLIVNKVR